MRPKLRVLWIEDGARFDLPHLAAPVYMDGSYDLFVAENVSEGISQLLKTEFQVVIVDIRLPPGNDQRWIEMHKRAGYDNVAARLGLKLLYSILGSTVPEVELANRPAWITPRRIGILTVEAQSELKGDLDRLGITVFQQKHADVPETVLLDVIKNVANQV